ncbi:TPR_REGION domain-containing protein [Tenacibaculum sp. 190524A05c]|uniref:tetratricopeptide repeat protein n=1 Tax=Tenacibaculum platacis TaxID=3137852 RepID=UPI0031FB5EB7
MRNLFLILFLLVESFSLNSQIKIDSTLIRLEIQLKSAQTDSLKVEALLKLASYQKKRNYNKVITYCNEIHKILDNVNYDARLQRAKAFVHSGIYKRRKSKYIAALKDYYLAEGIYIKQNYVHGLAGIYHNIGFIYQTQKEYRKSISLLNKAIFLNDSLKRYSGLGNNYNVMSICYKNLQEIDSAFIAVNKAIEYFELDNYEEGKQQAIANKASLLTRQKNFKEALDIYLNYLEYVKGINKERSIVNTNTNIANIYLKTEQYDLALKYVNNGIELAISQESEKYLYKGYLIRSKIYEAMNKHDLAFNDVLKYNAINQRINSAKIARELREIEVLHEEEKQRIRDSIIRIEEKKNQIITSNNKKLRKQLYGSIFLIFTLLIIIIVYYGYQKQLKTKKKQLFKEELSDINRQTNHSVKRNKKLPQNELKSPNIEEEYSLAQIIAELKKESIEEDRIQLLKNKIKTINKDFLQKLKKEHPKLTKTDIEVCSFIKIGLSRREISNIRKTSLEAIKSTRFRLKKKLELSKDQKLDEYIQSI